VPSLSLLFRARISWQTPISGRANQLQGLICSTLNDKMLIGQNVKDFHLYIAGQNDAVEYVFSNFS
jgi:hypothetical protein